jgi:sister chromatid cohesion protein DCC1
LLSPQASIAVGTLRIIPTPTLSHILLLILDTIVIHSQSHNCVSLYLLYDSLSDGHEVPHEVTTQIVEWFGEVDRKRGTWKVDVDAVVKYVGLGVLSEHKVSIAIPLCQLRVECCVLSSTTQFRRTT